MISQETSCYWSDNGDGVRFDTHGPGEPVQITVMMTKRFLWFTWETRSSVVLPWRMVGSLYRQLDPVRGMK